jgi:two-component sensor histidine kinase/signal transduction histidine kinase
MYLNEIKLKHQFLLIVLLSSIPFFIITNILTLSIMLSARGQLQTLIEDTTTRLNDTFEAQLRSNVTTYLLSKVEAGSDLIYKILSDSEFSDYTIAQKKQIAIEELMSLQVGKTGYFYAVDSKGTVIFHPDEEIIGKDFSLISPVPKQLELRNGYFEYKYQNSFETQVKNKALYMNYITEFDWILTATSYRDDFTEMFDRESIRKMVTEIRIGKSGYSYVIDRNGELIAHPLYKNDSEQILLVENNFTTLVDTLFSQKEGYVTYQWKNDMDSSFRKKIVYIKYIEDFDWVVCTAIYENEGNNNITIVFFANLVIALIIAVCLFIIVRRVSRNIEIPISGIYKTLLLANDGDLSVRTQPGGPVEIKTLGENLNNFITTLESRTLSLEATINAKDSLLREIQHRIKNNIQTILSLLNLQTDFSTNEDTISALLATQNRISVMSLVYDHMLLSDSNFKKDTLLAPDFLNSYINSSLLIDYSQVNLMRNFEDIYIKRNTAISLGLIINELLSYCIDNYNGVLSELSTKISLKQINDLDIVFEIEDNKCSFSPEKWNKEQNTLTFALVEVLTQQLSGSITQLKQDGTYYFQIKFPLISP